MHFEIQYPDDFKNKVRAEFPENKQLLEKLDKNSLDLLYLLRNLEKDVKEILTPEKILRAFRDGKLTELKLASERAIRIGELIYEWHGYYSNHCSGEGNRREVG